MPFDPQRHHRRSIRLKGYDYLQAGAYFVTICAQNRECLFGEIVDGEMRLNGQGEIVIACWIICRVIFRAIESVANLFEGQPRIEVADIEKEGAESQVFLRLDEIKSEKKTLTARIALHKLMKDGLQSCDKRK